MGKDLSTVLICSACKGTLFKEKNHEGSILLHCTNCGGSAKVAKAGIGFAVVAQVQESGRVFPTAKEKVEKEGKSEASTQFEILEFRLPPAVKKVVQAALWTAKCKLQVTGSWYGGAMLAHICADFLSGVDFSDLAPDDLQRITTLLQEAAEDVEQQKSGGKIFATFAEGFRESAEKTISSVASGTLVGLPEMVKEKQEEFEKQKKEGYQERVGKAVQARKAKSFGRLEACVRALDMQLREVSESGSPDDALDRDYLDEALETGTGFLAAVKAGERTMSDPQVQRFMKMTEEKLGLKSPRQKREEEVDDEE